MQWYPKPFGPGDLAGQGALKLLGMPQLDVLTLLVRETAQNSWDARVPGRAPEWELHARELDPNQRHTLRSQVFAERGSGIDLSATCGECVEVLEISDRGTMGLGGPTRNDQPVAAGESTNYIDLVLSVGASRNASGSGGTFGFGKTVAYLASRSHSIVIWSRARVGSQIESRLVASAIGHTFVDNGRSFTGRHWWGHPGGSVGGFEPVTGPDADAIAEQLFSATFGPGETGTSIMILEPDLREHLRDTAEDAATAVLWNLWPKMLAEPGADQSPMHLRILHNGERLPLPDPMTDHRIQGYARSLQAIRAWDRGEDHGGIPGLTSIHPITFGKGARPMGRMAIDRRPSFRIGAKQGPSADEAVDPYSGDPHHLALLRNSAELVVEYLELDPPPESGIAVCGVFRCDESTDREFALAEPPAHDTWSEKTIQDRDIRSHVRTTLRKIRETWRSEMRPHQKSGTDGNQRFSVAQVSNHLAGLVPDVPGNRATYRTSGGASARGGAGRSGRRRGAVSISIEAGAPVSLEESRIRFKVSGVDSPISLRADASIGYDGGSERSSADHDVRISGFRRPGELKTTVPGNILRLDQDHQGDWEFLVHHAPGIAIDASIVVVDS